MKCFAPVSSVILWLVSAIPIQACSAFLLKGDNYKIIGFNENWKHLPGMVVINKRGIEKRCLSWSDLIGAHPEPPRMRWITKYGSVTFNAFGIDLPCFGMNEKGLFLVELFLDKTYSIPDGTRPRMFWAQWIQYQLDNCATVDEVIRNLSRAPVIDWWPNFPGSHFFVTDATGQTAAIEYIEGKLVVSTRDEMPQPVLCNRPYQEEMAGLAQFQDFGGDRRINEPKDYWNLRFAVIAHRLKNYRPGGELPLEFAWKLLDNVRSGTWQLVADVTGRTVYFRSIASGSIKSISLAACDFSTESPIRFIDLHTNFRGDIVPHLAPWTPEINQAYVLAGFPAGYEQEAFYKTAPFAHLQRNLINYGRSLQRQVKTSATEIDRSGTAAE